MNKQETLKQADYAFQRGNRRLAEKLLSDLLAQHPNEESAWMLMARVLEDRERRIECYERALRVNPNNTEARIGLARAQSRDKTIPVRKLAVDQPFPTAPSPIMKILRTAVGITVLALIFGTTTYVIAKNNPESTMAKLIIPATQTPFAAPLPADIAPETRAEVITKFPQYATLVDTLISFAVNNAVGGMDGAPERPGVPIVLSDTAAAQAKITLEQALPQPGSLKTLTLTEQQVTSWLAMEMKNSPDLPLHDVQVYLQNGQIQVWGMVDGSSNSTSVLMSGKINLEGNGIPSFEIDSLQIGRQSIPGILLSQAQTWLNQQLAENINQQVPGLQIMNINISNGLITISGMR